MDSGIFQFAAKSGESCKLGAQWFWPAGVLGKGRMLWTVEEWIVMGAGAPHGIHDFGLSNVIISGKGAVSGVV